MHGGGGEEYYGFIGYPSSILSGYLGVVVVSCSMYVVLGCPCVYYGLLAISD